MMLILMQKLREEGKTPVYINGEDIDFVGIRADDLDSIEAAYTFKRILQPASRKVNKIIQGRKQEAFNVSSKQVCKRDRK